MRWEHLILPLCLMISTKIAIRASFLGLKEPLQEGVVLRPWYERTSLTSLPTVLLLISHVSPAAVIEVGSGVRWGLKSAF